MRRHYADKAREVVKALIEFGAALLALLRVLSKPKGREAFRELFDQELVKLHEDELSESAKQRGQTRIVHDVVWVSEDWLPNDYETLAGARMESERDPQRWGPIR